MLPLYPVKSLPEAVRRRAEEDTHADPVRGDPGRTARSRPSTTSTGTTSARASTWTSSRASRCSARSTSSTPAPAGRASPGRWSPATSSRRQDRSLFTVRTEVRSRHRRLAPGPRLRRRPRAHGPALLHELGRPAVHPQGGPGEGGLRAVREAVRQVRSHGPGIPC